MSAISVEFALQLSCFVILLHTYMRWTTSTATFFGFCIENMLCSVSHQNHCLCVCSNAFGMKLCGVHIDHQCGFDFAFLSTLSTISWKVQPFTCYVLFKCCQSPRSVWLISILLLIHDFILNSFFFCRTPGTQGTFAVWCYFGCFCFWNFRVLLKCMANWFGSGFRWFVDSSSPVSPVKSRSDHDAIHQSLEQKSWRQISHLLILIVLCLSSHRWQPHGLTSSFCMELNTCLYRDSQWGALSIQRLSNVYHHWNVIFWIFPFAADLFHLSLDFDSSLGFPGEGPQSSWLCCTANVDAVQTHPDCLNWSFDAVALQETRINQTVHQQVSFDLEQCNKSLIHGGLLIPKKTKANTYVTPHGGVAIIASKGLMRKFSGDDDLTGLWSDLALTTRISAAWVQVLPKLRVLIFTFYGETSRHDNSHLKINDFYLEKIFAIASQFGDIPVILCGDFQADPDTYPAVTSAKQHGWVDPLTSQDEHGNSTRPITFSRNAVFDQPTEFFSSIDAMLVNRPASSALTSMEVDYSRAKQHAPIVAKFEWPKILIQGTILNIPAPLNLEKLPKTDDNNLDMGVITSNSKQLWDNKFGALCHSGNDDTDWDFINKFAIETLTSSGASFKHGLATRAQPPTFTTSTPCPGQMKCGCVYTKAIAELTNFHKQLVELCVRLARPVTNVNDYNVTRILQQKVLRKAFRFKLEIPYFEHFMTIAQVKNLQKQVSGIINKKRDESKRIRIRNWKQKMIFGTQTKNVHSFVYKWIQSKTQIEVPNLIVDASGNTLYDPSEAIHEINLQWDKVFSANVLHQNPVDLLRFIWPYIDEIRHEATIPDLTGQMLRQQVLRRKANTAAGIDGWRTVEMYSLPVFVYDQVATFFRAIEDGTRSMPKQLATAKQVLLNKNGRDDPMQKRIISLLPIFLLAYTGTRFRHLQAWQRTVFPLELKGGIKGRNLSEIPVNLRLCIDSAKESNRSLVGIKLDKSKCFDRIVHSLAAALLLGFGCPKKVVTFFMGIYTTLTRFLCYKNWCSNLPTTASNGVVQGCSFSLLAINAYMSGWALLLKRIPHIQFASYIDDCYIWSHLEYINNLEAALDVTDKWDELTGQKINKDKCQAFGTTTNARKALKNRFPELDHSHVVTVLGANLNVTNNKNMSWPEEKTQKLHRDLKSIRAIPCSREVAAHLIATKVIPQLNFMPSLNFIPKKILQSVQDEITNSLWKNRPMWRSRWLVLGILSCPYRNEPFLARAFTTILETMNFLKTTNTENRNTWKKLVQESCIQQNSLLASFMQACSVLGLKICDPFTLQIELLPSVVLPILDCTRRDLKSLLSNLCRHQCYIHAGETVRKDTHSAIALLDFDVSKLAHSALKNQTVAGMRLTAFRDSTIVGCTVTHDRCFKAGLSLEPTCRFCGFHKETMQHLASECPSIPGDMNRPHCPNLGPNFEILGVAEISLELAKRRLEISDPTKLQVQAWAPDCPIDFLHVWTDGSCELSHMYWHTIGGFAIIDHNDCVVNSGEVHHFALTSFSCELWAVIVAFLGATGPLYIHSDCDSLVKMIHLFPVLESIPTDWPHFTWFSYLLQIYQIRKGNCANPLVLEWCPSHILEHIPWFQISHAIATQHQTTVANIRHNRTADRIAKVCVKRQLATFSPPKAEILTSATVWQKWLVHIATQIALSRGNDNAEDSQPNIVNPPAPCDNHENRLCIPNVYDITPEHSLEIFKFYLPKWMWEPEIEKFDWVSSFPSDHRLSSYACISQANWETALAFFRTLKWQINENLHVSYIELAFHFHYSGFSFVGVDQTPSKISTIIRKVINQASKCNLQHALVCGTQKAGCISEGKTLPAGFVKGCKPLLNITAIKNLAVQLLRGRKHGLKHWDFPLN